MDNSTIKEFLDKIGGNKSYRGVLLDDYPSPNHAAQMIAERVQAIVFSLENFRGYVDKNKLDDLINNIWSKEALQKDSIEAEIDELELPNFTLNSNQATIKDLSNNDIKSDSEPSCLNDLKDKYSELQKVVEESFKLFKGVWCLISSDGKVKTEEVTPSLRQLYDWSALITHNVTFEPKEIGYPKWTDLSNKLMEITKANNNCCSSTLETSLIAVFGVSIVCIIITGIFEGNGWLNYIFIFSILTTIVLLLCKFLKYQTKQCDVDMKLKEKMMNVVVDAFNEDREFSIQRTKVEIALHDKLEKARIEEWIKNKENERKLNIMEQERIAELNNVLLELAKVKNTVTLSDPNGSGKTVTIESSVLSNDYMNELEKIIKNQSNQALGDHIQGNGRES